jgi:hypothetical protein
LLDKGLAQALRVLALKREEVRIAGRAGSLTADLGRLSAGINGINIQLVQLDMGWCKKSIENLRDSGYRILELFERSGSISIGSHVLMRTLSCPEAFTATRFCASARFTIHPTYEVYYTNDLPLVMQTHVQRVHIGQFYIGQDITLNFASFSQCTTPQLFGTVTKVSANVLTNQVTGTNCNQAEIVPKLGEIENLAVLNWCQHAS